MNTAFATLASLAVSYDEDYADDDENKSKNKDVNENKPMDHNVSESSAVTE
jgi:hypothetical protein